MNPELVDTGLLMSLGGGTLAGVAVGVALRTTAKLALMLTGFLILALWGLVHLGIVTVDWTALSQGLESGAEIAGSYVQLAVADLSAQFVGFAAGVALGFKFR